MNNKRATSKQQGAVAIYMVLIILLLVTSAAIILSGILSRQIQASQSVVASERAFYAANSGIEEAYYELVRQIRPDTIEYEPITLEGMVEYDNGDRAAYEVNAQLVSSEGEGSSVTPCIISIGTYPADSANSETRRISLQPAGVECDLD